MERRQRQMCIRGSRVAQRERGNERQIAARAVAGEHEAGDIKAEFVGARRDPARRRLTICLLYTPPSPRDRARSRIPPSA